MEEARRLNPAATPLLTATQRRRGPVLAVLVLFRLEKLVLNGAAAPGVGVPVARALFVRCLKYIKIVILS